MQLITILALLMTQENYGQTPHFNWTWPVNGEIAARYRCANEVQFRIRFDESRIELLSYTGSSGPATPEELAQWNEWLQPLKTIDNYDFACIGESERLIIQGPKRSDNKTSSLLVYWHNNEMRRTPDSFASNERP